MTRMVWLTDLHLNFCSDEQIGELAGEVLQADPDVVLVGGDIGEAGSVVGYLERLDDAWQRPLCFVLGNHDFYYGSIGQVRQAVTRLCDERPRLTYLSAATAPLRLTPRVALVGHDGWADGRIGNYAASVVMMNDYKLIAELAGYSKGERWQRLQQLGDEAAEHLERVLPPALEGAEQVYVLTHVPPAREACWYEGRPSDDEWAPHFTCQAVGETLRQTLRRRPDRRATVLCGHTHGEGYCQLLPNLEIYTGGAVYGSPEITRIVDLDADRTD